MSPHRILTPEDREKLIVNLDECLALFETKKGLLNGAELRAKSLLNVLKDEVERRSLDGSVLPFE